MNPVCIMQLNGITAVQINQHFIDWKSFLMNRPVINYTLNP
jgi:hypothetical protein